MNKVYTKIGDGAFSSVYKVDDYAIKEMKNTTSVKVLLIEIAILKACASNHIIRAYSFDNRSIKMELAVGTLLDNINCIRPNNEADEGYIHSNSPIPLSERNRDLHTLSSHILHGISYLHSIDMCHADITHSNIMMCIVDGELRWKLADFTCVCPNGYKYTSCPVSYLYIPPEVMYTLCINNNVELPPVLRDHKFGNTVTLATDIWMCGMLLYTTRIKQLDLFNVTGKIDNNDKIYANYTAYCNWQDTPLQCSPEKYMLRIDPSKRYTCKSLLQCYGLCDSDPKTMPPNEFVSIYNMIVNNTINIGNVCDKVNAKLPEDHEGVDIKYYNDTEIVISSTADKQPISIKSLNGKRSIFDPPVGYTRRNTLLC